MDLYNWARVLHILSFVSWMAAMLYLPRLYVYHVGTPVGSEASELFKVMERRLLRGIMNPAMIASWGFGIWLIWINGGSTVAGYMDFFIHTPWLHAKVSLLILMMFMHAFLSRVRRQLAEDRRYYSSTFFRVINEVPTVLMIGIVILAILKPW